MNICVCALSLFACHACFAGGNGPKVTVLYSLKSGTHAPYLDVHPIPGADGNFYGTTDAGGDKGFGTVFRSTPAGVRTVLHDFTDYPDGSNPCGALILGKDGNLYGTTSAGGSKSYGTVYKITPAGRLTILHSFTGVGFDREPSEGNSPQDGLVQGNDGNFYGKGTVFRILNRR
jgi:uncharacterized repeat protein (TIGR03803 family)